ncbi:hypothetical protein J7E91_22160 [Streptomyces sp. ISL-99]|uniref:hypothetical protein n=1 Tax=Streptomyces sp. ISL-99 TaxID=2819193 RepID=UPI001BEC7354|nr:hypothetical protein [Streptomyces sp. ISL-99]MBT2528045.1 hypothetical protein [Streptomyces sp. ISL-99]
MIDVHETAVVEPAREIRSADQQLSCEGGVTFEEAPGFSASLPTYECGANGRVHSSRH